MVDFNGMTNSLGLFYVKRLGNHIHSYSFAYLFLKKNCGGEDMVLSNTNDF